MGTWLSERSIRALLDLIEVRVRDLDTADRQDMNDWETLEQCRCELETLKAMAEAPQDVMRRAQLAGVL
jgi:hypothetical protein